MSESTDPGKAPHEEAEETASEGENKPSDLDRAKEDFKGAAEDAKEQAGRLGEKLKDEDTRKKIGDVAGKLKGLRRRI
jgi:hypothetical protein